jgi:hypothetical protein
MPTSNYPAFEVKIDNDDGTTSPVPGETVKVYDVTNSAALSDIASDGDGHVAAGTVPVAAGTEVRFSFNQVDGHCGYAEVITT